jgi:SOS-response transcriptional repressor LexA
MTTFKNPHTLRVYEYIRDFIQQTRLNPTIREIGEGVYMSHSAVLTHLAHLEAKGWIVREIGVARSIRLGEHAPDYVP